MLKSKRKTETAGSTDNVTMAPVFPSAFDPHAAKLFILTEPPFQFSEPPFNLVNHQITVRKRQVNKNK